MSNDFQHVAWWSNALGGEKKVVSFCQKVCGKISCDFWWSQHLVSQQPLLIPLWKRVLVVTHMNRRVFHLGAASVPRPPCDLSVSLWTHADTFHATVHSQDSQMVFSCPLEVVWKDFCIISLLWFLLSYSVFHKRKKAWYLLEKNNFGYIFQDWFREDPRMQTNTITDFTANRAACNIKREWSNKENTEWDHGFRLREFRVEERNLVQLYEAPLIDGL